ncbi:hypothetical protein [Leptolyngbya sp. 7M]|uniref:hypothetical protein n=1 Tax=Leptolyngbya sp. 7M TaxID=2812896 RepID=UPI001B8C708C|nr:hypothetical protein [Leptolyngbya sp. 7M]QYO67498.1 hypothetical protein JVX88_12305 [Leptolyngbya sp. 7M]
MTTEFNELLDAGDCAGVQIWIIGTREQLIHQINEFYVKRIATDRSRFTPLIPAPFGRDKYMTMLIR